MTVVSLRDVTLRDGLQDERPVATSSKIALFDALVTSGVSDLELTSFVRAERVPAVADAEAMVAATASSSTTRWGLVLNRRGAERALAAGLTHLQFVISVSDEHSRVNAGVSTDEAIRHLREVVELATPTGGIVELTIATAFGSPYEGPIDQSAVLALADRAVNLGVASISLADTIGVALPHEVASLVGATQHATGLRVGVHLHDARGLALANALAAIEVGVDRIDGAVGGLGGCPFSPGAGGNLALEDLVHVLEESGVNTGISLDGLIEAARMACEMVGRTLSGHVAMAGRRFATRAQ
jgi:hydroxymethylglutaryl-CoA lyase